jgi:hypothetical protein
LARARADGQVLELLHDHLRRVSLAREEVEDLVAQAEGRRREQDPEHDRKGDDCD